jgi:periplasmic divalent cation tolerance protein
MNSKQSQYCIVITTCASQGDAEDIIGALLSDRLVACVQVFQITSYYSWKGAQAKEPEHILLIKALTRLYPAIERSIRANHKYETPEIVQIPIIAGSESYLGWMREVSRS